ncbi:unnamed protein product [Natator depressus]
MRLEWEREMKMRELEDHEKQRQHEEKQRQHEQEEKERERQEKEKQRQHELELARLRSSGAPAAQRAPGERRELQLLLSQQIGAVRRVIPSDPVQLVVADPSLPRPSISLSPTGVTAPGADVTIRCQGQRWDVRFFLHKAGDLNPPGHTDPAGDGAEFHIPTVGRQDGGSYSCSYWPPSEPFISSDPSDPVQLVVAEPSYPKPSISLSPSGGVSLGGAVSVWCRGQHRDMRFVLNKEGRHFQTVDPKGFEAVFPISNVSWEDGGSYSCSYHSRSKPSAASSPSDPVELVVRACLLCADPSLPRPSISLSPTGVTTPGANVTIRCEGQRRDVRFFLHKAGDLNPPRDMDPAGDGAEFHIPTVGRQHGGNYSCSYRPPSEPFVSSDPSDPVELVVAAAPPGTPGFHRCQHRVPGAERHGPAHHGTNPD